MFYNFNIKDWIRQVLPTVLRKGFLISLLSCLLQPLSLIIDALLSYKRSVDERLAYNAFVIYLQRFLNNLLGQPDGTIYIIDNADDNALFLSLKAENQPPQYIGLKKEDAPLYVSVPGIITGVFVVMVPEELATEKNIAELKRWIEFYRYAGTRYEIKTYSI